MVEIICSVFDKDAQTNPNISGKRPQLEFAVFWAALSAHR